MLIQAENEGMWLWSKPMQLDEQVDRNNHAGCNVFIIPMPTNHLMSMEIIGDIGIDLDYIAGTKSTMIV